MFGLSFGEIAIIAILALFLLGPDRLPEAARTIGKTVRDLKKATDGLKDQLQQEVYAAERSVERLVKAPEVPPVTAAAMAASPRVPAPAPTASADNVPGLEAALVEVAAPPAPEPPVAPAATPARPA
jgi:sec-independent protein translocase protein TatB